MIDVLVAARKRFEEQRSRAEKPIALTVQQLDRLAATLGENPVVPAAETRSALDRALLPDDQIAELAACIAWVRDEPARVERARLDAEAAAAERARLRDEAVAKLGLTAEQVSALFGA